MVSAKPLKSCEAQNIIKINIQEDFDPAIDLNNNGGDDVGLSNKMEEFLKMLSQTLKRIQGVDY